jgi:hypothetical protein
MTNNLTLFITGCSYIFWVALIVLRLTAPKGIRLTSRDILLLTATMIGIPMCFIFSIFALSLPERITNSVQLDNHHYYLTESIGFGDQLMNYNFIKCDEKDLECKDLFQFTAESWVKSVAVIIDHSKQEINIVVTSTVGNETLIYSYSLD